MLKVLNNKVKVRKIGGSLFVNLTPYLKDLNVKEGQYVVVNSDRQLRAFSEVKIVTLEKYNG